MTDLGRQGSIERRTGLYRLLEVSRPYALVQRALGTEAAWRVLRERFIRPEPGMRILDVGAGTGNARPHLGDVEYTALEPNPRYVEAMRQRFADTGETVIQGLSDDLATLEGEFDRVLMIGLLHHLADDAAARALALAGGRLAPGGRVVTLDTCFHEGQHPLAKLLTGMDRGANVRTVEGYRALARPSFADVQVFLSTGLIRIPFSHVAMTCADPLPAASPLEGALAAD